MSDIEAPLLETNDFEGNESCYIAKSFLDENPYKVIYVLSKFSEHNSYPNVRCCGRKMKEEHHISDCQIDGINLADDLVQALETLHVEGYKLQSITSINNGNYKTTVDYGAGWSYTQGLMVVGVKN